MTRTSRLQTVPRRLFKVWQVLISVPLVREYGMHPLAPHGVVEHAVLIGPSLARRAQRLLDREGRCQARRGRPNLIPDGAPSVPIGKRMHGDELEAARRRVEEHRGVARGLDSAGVALRGGERVLQVYALGCIRRSMQSVSA